MVPHAQPLPSSYPCAPRVFRDLVPSLDLLPRCCSTATAAASRTACRPTSRRWGQQGGDLPGRGPNSWAGAGPMAVHAHLITRPCAHFPNSSGAVCTWTWTWTGAASNQGPFHAHGGTRNWHYRYCMPLYCYHNCTQEPHAHQLAHVPIAPVQVGNGRKSG